MRKMTVLLMLALGVVQLSFTPAGRVVPIAAGGVTATGPVSAGNVAVTAPPAAGCLALAPFNEQILENVNQFRADNGKPPLTMNPDMVETAAIHSQAMAKGTVPFGHDNFDLRFKYVSAKLGGVNAFAENVAMGKMDARQVVDGWAHSPGHRKNMLGDYNLTGIATATAADGQIYFTQIFAHKQ